MDWFPIIPTRRLSFHLVQVECALGGVMIEPDRSGARAFHLKKQIFFLRNCVFINIGVNVAANYAILGVEFLRDLDRSGKGMKQVPHDQRIVQSFILDSSRPFGREVATNLPLRFGNLAAVFLPSYKSLN